MTSFFQPKTIIKTILKSKPKKALPSIIKVIQKVNKGHSIARTRPAFARYQKPAKYGYFSYTNVSLQKAFINPLESYGLLL